MNLANPSTLFGLAFETLKSPRHVFSRLQDLNLPRHVLWQALFLVSILSVIAAVLVSFVPAPAQPDGTEVPEGMISPIAFGAIQLGIMLITIALIDRIGRGMGGTGTLNDAILAVTWLQFILLCLQVVQTLAIVVLPGLAGLVLLAGLGIFFWLLTAFTTEMHGFKSAGRVFGMILFVLMGVALGLSFLLTLTGVTVQ